MVARSEPHVLGVPLVVRRAAVVPDLGEAEWETAVDAAEQVFKTTGVRSRAPGERRWAAGEPGRPQVRLAAVWVPGGARLDAEVVRPQPRPWFTAVALVFGASALVAVAGLSGVDATPFQWGGALALAAVPVVAALWTVALHRVRNARIGGRLVRVLRSVERTAWSRAAEWAHAEEVVPTGDEDEDMATVLPVREIEPPRWLDDAEADGLSGARPARVAPSDLRHARRVVERATAERRAPTHRDDAPDPAPDPSASAFAEWHPEPAAPPRRPLWRD